MSAFIVNEDCVNKIVTYLNAKKDDFQWVFRQQEYPGARYALCQFEDLDRLASDLFHMNCDAVDQRYGKGTAAHDTIEYPAFKFKFRPTVSPVMVYKAIQCLIYQCSEGDITERQLYKCLTDAKHAVAARIIQGMPEYDKSPWGE